MKLFITAFAVLFGLTLWSDYPFNGLWWLVFAVALGTGIRWWSQVTAASQDRPTARKGGAR